ncbi:MAG: conjugative coupling factor TraD, PFGI-1 class, partial [Gammaproteobacteria bacterium]|nr:conjugative coupling factor TraD, PFGI-1 class [Gammaproteobacteria bacterium]
MRDYPVDNLLREPTEAYAGLTYLACATLTLTHPHLFLLTHDMGMYAAITLSLPGVYRCYQALRVKRYHHRLRAMPYYALSTKQIPLSKKQLFIGRGFRWLPSHTQRLHQIKEVKNERFLKPSKSTCSVGGSPFLHGLGGKDKPVY